MRKKTNQSSWAYPCPPITLLLSGHELEAESGTLPRRSGREALPRGEPVFCLELDLRPKLVKSGLSLRKVGHEIALPISHWPGKFFWHVLSITFSFETLWMELKMWGLGLFWHWQCFLLTITYPYTYTLCVHQGLPIHLSVHETLRAVVTKSVTIPKSRAIAKLRKSSLYGHLPEAPDTQTWHCSLVSPLRAQRRGRQV